MTAAELFRYNLVRLTKASGGMLAVARKAWPLPDGVAPADVYRETESRRSSMRRLQSKARRGVPFSDLDALARALGVPVSEFFRPPTDAN